jgi:heat shock protein HslJ
MNRLCILLGLVSFIACNGGPSNPAAPTAAVQPPAAPTSSVTPSPAIVATGSVWKLQRFQRADGTNVPVPNPDQFTIEVGTDGRVSVKADCNRCSASYSQNGGSLQVNTLMACTRAYCPTAPFDMEYSSALSGGTIVSTSSEALEVRSAAGVLTFGR